MASKTKHSNKRVTERVGQINHCCSSTSHVLTRICSRPTPVKEDSGSYLHRIPQHWTTILGPIISIAATSCYSRGTSSSDCSLALPLRWPLASSPSTPVSDESGHSLQCFSPVLLGTSLAYFFPKDKVIHQSELVTFLRLN